MIVSAARIALTGGVVEVPNGTLANHAMAFGQKYTDAEAVAAVTGIYLPLTGGTLTGTLILPEGSVSNPSLVFTEPSNDTGFYGNDSLQRIGVSLDGGAACDIVFAASGFVSLLAGKDLGAAAFPWDTVHSVNTATEQINGTPAANIADVVDELVTWANGQAAGISTLA